MSIGTGMKVVTLVLMVAAGYLSGSLSWSIIVTKLATGGDIREMGNRNAGTSNVKRSVGIQYAVIVFFLDVAKAVVPMYLARIFLFPGGGYLDILAVFGVGMAAIAGHCRPVYFGFRGGGGITSSLGVFLFFAPLEFLLTLGMACGIVFFFIRNVRRRLTQWLPISFVTLAPLVLLAVNLTVDIRVSGRLLFGGHPWPVVVGTFAVAFFILGMNWKFMGRRAEEIRTDPPPNQKGGRDGSQPPSILPRGSA